MDNEILVIVICLVKIGIRYFMEYYFDYIMIFFLIMYSI